MSRFPLTHQSVLERIRSGDAVVRHGAFSDVAAGYWWWVSLSRRSLRS